MTYVYMFAPCLCRSWRRFSRKDCPSRGKELAVFARECPFPDLTKPLSIASAGELGKPRRCMSVSFGRFVLDESARALRLDGQERPLQPLVFDLLVYLVQHRERVVSKDELLTKLWSGAMVTDGSLQRAVSLLRSALREGGMDQ